MAQIALLIWILVILIINKDPVSGDVTFVEKSRILKLRLPDHSEDKTVESNGLGIKETVLDILKHRLGATSPTLNKHKQKDNKKLSNKPTRLVQSSSVNKANKSVKPVTKDIVTANIDPSNPNHKGVVASKSNKGKKDKRTMNNWFPVIMVSPVDDKAEFEEDEQAQIKADNIQVERKGRERRKFKNRLTDNQKCKEGTYIRRDCNLCMCIHGSWNCTSVKCNPGLGIDPSNKGHSVKLYNKLRDDATNCEPGDKVKAEDDKGCPCTCVLPSVMVCELCPAVQEIILPVTRDATMSPFDDSDDLKDYSPISDTIDSVQKKSVKSKKKKSVSQNLIEQL